jgi:hypothetical protein
MSRRCGTWGERIPQGSAGEEPPLTISEHARLRELEKEVRELRLERSSWEKPPLMQVIVVKTQRGGWNSC